MDISLGDSEAMDIRTVLSRNVKALRKSSRLTQDQLAKKAQVGQATISRIENGTESAADIDTLNRLAGALGCKAWRLLLDEQLVILPPSQH